MFVLSILSVLDEEGFESKIFSVLLDIVELY